jgi:periplasmic copper chaperone A
LTNSPALLAALAMCCAATACAPAAQGATGAAAAALAAGDAWVRATPGADVAAGYLTLHNGGSHPVIVVGVRCPLARHAMIHESAVSHGAASMRPHERLSIAPGETVRLAPGGMHVMLEMLAHPLNPGEKVPLQLLLEGGGTLEVTALVRPLSAG